MSKFYVIKDLLSLSDYSKKYNVSLRKIYRYIADGIVEHYNIGGVAFLHDSPIKLLTKSHTRNQLSNNVKILTETPISVKILTESSHNVDNQEVNNIKILTEYQEKIVNTSDSRLNALDLDRKYKILEEIENLKKL